MYYAVIHRPDADISKIQEIDAKYDPYHGLVDPHVTLLFPVKDQDIDLEVLSEHVADVASQVEPFETEFASDSTELSWDQWLFLTPKQNDDKFRDLHARLYSGICEKFLRKDLPFSPHIGIGHFAVKSIKYDLKESVALPLDNQLYKQALNELDKAAITFDYEVKDLELIGVDDDYTKSWTIARFSLGKT